MFYLLAIYVFSPSRQGKTCLHIIDNVHRGLFYSKYPILGYFCCCRLGFMRILPNFAGIMDKRKYRSRYNLFRKVLKAERKSHSISQEYLAEMLGVKQSFISKTEIGARRLDVMELLELCDAMGILLTDFVFRMEGRLLNEGLLTPERKEAYMRWWDIYNAYYSITDIQEDGVKWK